MQCCNVRKEFKCVAFDFLYFFSKFEYVLKSFGFLKPPNEGNKQRYYPAEPDWYQFIRKNQVSYKISENACELIKAGPKQQVVYRESQRLGWEYIEKTNKMSELAYVIRLIKTIRNNLFHGGKYGYDDIERDIQLLRLAISILNELTCQFNLMN